MWAVGEKTKKKPLFFDVKKTMSEMGKTLGSKIFEVAWAFPAKDQICYVVLGSRIDQ